jgi:hypothetical protein
VNVIPLKNTRSFFRKTLFVFSVVSAASASPSSLMTREMPPLSSILDRVAIYYVHVQTHHACLPCMRAMSPVVCSGCTRRSEGCYCCSIQFRPLLPELDKKPRASTRRYPLDAPLSRLAQQADRQMQQYRWTGHAVLSSVECDESQGRYKAMHPHRGHCNMKLGYSIKCRAKYSRIPLDLFFG